MALFPVIHSNGGRAQYPNGVSFENLTNATNLACNSHVAFPWRTEPLARYTLNLKKLTDAEVAVIETFFAAQNGRFGQFAYIDPTGNLLQYSDDYAQAPWTKVCTVGAALADPAGGTAASTLIGNGSGNSSLSQVVALEAAIAGSVACFSVYLKAITAVGAFNVYLTDGTTTTNQACALALDTWKRVSVPWTFGATGSVTVGVGGNSAWLGADQIAMFGPMLCMTTGAASYLRTPGFAAYRPLCRFDQDVLDITYRAPNQNDVTLRIHEIAPAIPLLGSIALIMDLSGSIATTASLPDEQAGAIAFLNALPAAWRAGLWSFGNRGAALTQNQVNTLNRATLIDAVNALASPTGGTPLYDSIRTVSATQPTNILLLTDGDDAGGSTHTQADAISAANNAGVSVFALGFGAPNGAALAALTSQTGGAYVIAATPAQIRTLVLQIVGQL